MTYRSLRVAAYDELLRFLALNKDPRKLESFRSAHELAGSWFTEFNDSWKISTNDRTAPIRAASIQGKRQIEALRLLSLYNRTYNQDPISQYPQPLHRFSLEKSPPPPGKVFLWDHKSHPGVSSWTTNKVLTNRKTMLEDFLEDSKVSKEVKHYRDVHLITDYGVVRNVVWDYRSLNVLFEAREYIEELYTHAAHAHNDKLKPLFYRLRLAVNNLYGDIKGGITERESEVILYHPKGLKVKVFGHDKI